LPKRSPTTGIFAPPVLKTCFETARASFCLDNTQAEVDRFIEVVKEIQRFSGNDLRLGTDYLYKIMIKCTIEIKEIPGKCVYINMIPDQADATQQEIRTASCLDMTIKAVGQYLMAKTGSGQSIEGKDVGVVQMIFQDQIKKFES